MKCWKFAYLFGFIDEIHYFCFYNALGKKHFSYFYEEKIKPKRQQQ